MPGAIGKEPIREGVFVILSAAAQSRLGLIEVRGLPYRLHIYRMNNQTRIGHIKPEPRFVSGGKIRNHLLNRAKAHGQSCIRANHLQVKLRDDLHLRFRHALGLNFCQNIRGQMINPRRRSQAAVTLQSGLNRFGPAGANIRKPHPVGTQKGGHRMDQTLLHPQNIGNRTCVLGACPTKNGQTIAGHVIAPLDRDFLDRIGHILNGNAQKPVCNLFRGFPDFDTQSLKLRPCGCHI